MGVLWQLFHMAYDNLQYEDTHPFFQQGRWTRVYPYTPSFKLYENGLNDDHIATALRSISKELGLFTTFPEGKAATPEQKPMVDLDRRELALAFMNQQLIGS